MKKPIQVEIRAFAFSNTPILQCSSTPKELATCTGKTIELRLSTTDLDFDVIDINS